jgi:hypothetical protein
VREVRECPGGDTDILVEGEEVQKILSAPDITKSRHPIVIFGSPTVSSNDFRLGIQFSADDRSVPCDFPIDHDDRIGIEFVINSSNETGRGSG